MNSEVFHSDCWQQALFLVSLVDCFLLFFGWFFIQKPQVFSSQACSDQYYAEYSRGTLCRSLAFSLMQLFLFWYSALQSCLSFTGLSSSAQLRGTACLTFPGFLCPMLPAGNSLQAISWACCRIYFICFPFLRDHCTLLLGFQCLQNCCFLYCLVFSCLRHYRVNLVPVTPLWMEAKV